MSDRRQRLELIERLKENTSVAAAIMELEDQRDGYYKNLARTLSQGTLPVDQRDVDYKRGFWKGAFWALQTLPKKATAELEKALEAALTEEGGSS